MKPGEPLALNLSHERLPIWRRGRGVTNLTSLYRCLRRSDGDMRAVRSGLVQSLSVATLLSVFDISLA